MQSYEFEGKPSFYVDVSDTFEIKMDSIKAYTSQVYVPGQSKENEPQTRLSRPEFLEEIESRAIYCGTHIGARYAEAFMAVEPIGLKSLSDLM
jgi:LmbE family N-acetylglucosaminyl deacetylase